MQSRRGFLRMIGLGAAAVAVGPTILRLGEAPKVDAVTKHRVVSVDELNDYFMNCGRRMQEEILRQLAATNPYMKLFDNGHHTAWVADDIRFPAS